MDEDNLGPTPADHSGGGPDTESTSGTTTSSEVAGASTAASSRPDEAVEGFTTVSGSAYEVDLPGHRIRRVGNAAGRAPTPRLGRDGQWRTFLVLALTAVPPEPGPSILIRWDETGGATITSMISTLSPAIRHLVEQDGLDEEALDE